MTWEPFDTPREMYGVFNVAEPYSATLIAAFASRLHAEVWIEFVTQGAKAARDKDLDADVADTRFWHALPIRGAAGEFWNSYEEPPP